MDRQSLSFRVTCISDRGQRSIKVKVNHISIQSLRLGNTYWFSVATVGNKGSLSKCVSASVQTVIPAPVELTEESVDTTSFTLSWREPHGLDQTPCFLVSYSSPGTEPQFISTESLTVTLSNLQPGTEYTVSVFTELENGNQSEAASKSICTKPSAPGRVRVEEVRSRSVRLCWDTPTEMEGVSYTFSISYRCAGEKPKEVRTGSNSNTTVLSDLRAGVEYSFSVSTVLHNGSRSRASSAKECTRKLHISSVDETSVSVSWDRPTDMKGVPHTFRVTWGDSRGQTDSFTTENGTAVPHLRPGTECSISVCTVLQSNGLESDPICTTVQTEPSAPGRVRVEEVRSRSVRLCWDTPTEMEGVSYTFSISYSCDGEEPKEQEQAQFSKGVHNGRCP
ncbi:hypothetical protein MATL_G00220610 [Megalops atlanticus]|uniref:Fibronectin type-III domain-containing protein n=1 Tax=Megalops atlanticus TaxID=7932 RepID=A0A9D3SW80_MEGAT|nr:hypothetical protein MATL_G00220610 [Megalops atlanticus]